MRFICTKCLLLLFMLGGMAGSAIAKVGIWTDVFVPGGGVSVVAVDTSGAPYAVIGGIVYRQFLGSGVWVSANSGLERTNIKCLLAGADGTMYAGTDAGIFKLTGDGFTWVSVNIGLTNTNITALLLDGKGALYAGTLGGGVFKRRGNADAWTAVNNGLSNGNITALALQPGGVLYAGSNGGEVFKSTDGGDSWFEAQAKLVSAVLALAVDAKSNIYAGIDSNGAYLGSTFGAINYDQSGYGLYKSVDNGTTWSAMQVAGPGVNYLAIDARGVLYLRAVQRNPRKIFTTTGGAYFIYTALTSVDGGVSFKEILHEGSALQVGSGGLQYLGTQRGDVFRRSEDDAFEEVRISVDPYDFYSGSSYGFHRHVAVDASGAIYIFDLAVYWNVLKSVDGGLNWTMTSSPSKDTPLRAMTTDASGALYAGMDTGVFKSTDGGMSWVPLYGLENRDIRMLYVDVDGTIYAGDIKGSLYRYRVGGSAWAQVQSGLNLTDIGMIYAIVRDTSGVLYIGTERGGIFKSGDAGGSWVPVKNSLMRPPVSIVAGRIPLAVDAHGALYLATYQGVFKTDNGGEKWVLVNGGLKDVFVDELVADVYGGVYAQEDAGIFKLSDGSSVWVAVNDGLPAANTSGGSMFGTLRLDKGGQLYTSYAGRLYRYMPSAAIGFNPRLVNLSGRANTLAGEAVAIAGFTISGGNKTVLLTAKGPSLAAAGVPNVLANPRLRVMDKAGTLIASNDNWADNLNVAGIIATQGAPSDPNESALLLTLPPGAYTAIMEGVSAGTGNGLVAVDGVANVEDSGALTNLSTRAMVGVGDDVLIAGLTIVDGPRKILLTAKGPSLTALGVSGALLNPTITLYDAAGTVLAENDDQASAANYAGIVATGKAPADPREAAILRELPPGKYTLIVRGSGGTQGIALVAVDLVD